MFTKKINRSFIDNEIKVPDKNDKEKIILTKVLYQSKALKEFLFFDDSCSEW